MTGIFVQAFYATNPIVSDIAISLRFLLLPALPTSIRTMVKSTAGDPLHYSHKSASDLRLPVVEAARNISYWASIICFEGAALF